MAQAREADGVLVLCDSDDDCPALWGPEATAIVQNTVRGAAVMVVREFETWLLLSQPEQALNDAGVRNPATKRDAKKALRKVVGEYLPTADQLDMTRSIDIEKLRTKSHSFDKLVRVV